MTHSEFAVGEEFFCGDNKWRCTDKGSRVITAICLDREDPSWYYYGPPYAVVERVFDESDMPGCSKIQMEKD